MSQRGFTETPTCLLIYACAECQERRAWGNVALRDALIGEPRAVLACASCGRPTRHSFVDREPLTRRDQALLHKRKKPVAAVDEFRAESEAAS